MQAASLTPELRAAAPAVAARLASAILLPLAALIAHAFLRDPRRVGIIVPLWTRLTRAARRFTRLMDRLAAGAAPRASRPGSAGTSTSTSTGSRPASLPSTRGWLVTDLRHEAAVYAHRLDALLAQPETAAIIAACPPAARILRPLCRMLGIRPATLSPGPRKCRRPAAPVPAIAAQRPREPAAASRPAFPDRPVFRPLHETVPCPHVGWPWFPNKPLGVA